MTNTIFNIGASLLKRFKHRKFYRTIAEQLYQKTVEAARNPAFYAFDDGVPDTIDGRKELLALHLFLIYERMADKPLFEGVSAALSNHITRDLEANLRELGAGDMKIGKKVKEASLQLYGRLDGYWGSFHGDPPSRPQDKAGCLGRNLFSYGGGQEDHTVTAMIAYIEQARQGLAALDDAQIMEGIASFPQFNREASS